MVDDSAFNSATLLRGADGPPQGIVLVVEDDHMDREGIVASLRLHGFDVLTARDGLEALATIAELPPDLVISEVTTASIAGIDLLRRLRAEPATSGLPFIFLTSLDGTDDIVRGFQEGADDYILKPVRHQELVARVRSKLARPPVPIGDLVQDRRSGLLTETSFDHECEFDLRRAERERVPVSIAFLELFELPGIRKTFGQRGEAIIAREIATLLTQRFDGVARLGVDENGRFMLLVKAARSATRTLLNEISRAVVGHRFHLNTEPVRLTPIVGFAANVGHIKLSEMRRRASIALETAKLHLDLQAVHYRAGLEPPVVVVAAKPLIEWVRASLKPLTAPFQVVAMLFGALVFPFLTYWFLAAHGFDISNVVYIIFVTMLFFTAVGIWWEVVLALKEVEPPEADRHPTASAIIAAYLPNEAATIVETIESFLRVQYAGDLQIILAYNTPRPLPMEEELLTIAQRDPRFVPMRVYGSTSKAQNVNAALRIVKGAFVGVFDADHKPDPDSFSRAWNWLASGYDIVQGHCLIRNGDESPIARLVAVEFESIYSVSHPGRTRMHGFGIFGGSNGYWKTDLLRQTRMHHFMLTEDIDSSLRVVEAGYRIATDRKLISRELAPITLRAFWNQRLRWAQGWFQVSLKHIWPALRSPHLNLQQKFGIMHLLVWRELYVWVSVQAFPILSYWMFIRHDHLRWFVPIFVVTTLLSTLTGPFQLIFTYLLADREVRSRRAWFWHYLFASFVFFAELKNIISRIAQLKELMRERTWKVTPRTPSL